MTQEYETIVVEKRDDGLMIVTFNRPEVYNAMNTAMMRELGDVFAPMVQRPGDVRCVILTGAGEKAFCSGGDLKQRNSMNDDQWFDQHLDAQRAIFSMADCPVPIICAVNGVAFAKEMVLAARSIDAEKALEWGLVNKICAEGKLMEEVMEVAEAICANAPLSVKQAKKAMTIARDVDRKTSHRFALEAYHRLILSEDRVEGMLAFNEKRTPVFKGR